MRALRKGEEEDHGAARLTPGIRHDDVSQQTADGFVTSSCKSGAKDQSDDLQAKPDRNLSDGVFTQGSK